MNNANHITASLHKEFIRLGRERNKITYKLLAILPQIFKLEIYKKYNYSNIYEYAGKLAGIPRSVVEKTLQVHKNLRGKPHLKKAVESEGIHKVALVAKLASPETDRAFADKVKNMSKHSLCELAREVRAKEKIEGANGKESSNASEGDGLFNGSLDGEKNKTPLCQAKPEQSECFSFPCHAAPSKIKIELDEEMQFLFLKLKKSMIRRGVKFGNHLSNKEVLRRILKNAEEKSEEKKEECISKKSSSDKIRKSTKQRNSSSEKFSREKNRKEIQADVNKREVTGREVAIQKMTTRKVADRKITSRYIPAHQKKAALSKSAGKCAYPGCLRPVDHFHHTKRYSEKRDHQSIMPLCKAHHEFAHNGLIGNEEGAVSKWRLNMEAGVNTYADAKFRAYRRE